MHLSCSVRPPSAVLACLLPPRESNLCSASFQFPVIHSFFLLLAALLRRRDNLLQATGPQLRRLLAEILSLEGLASAGFGSEENADTGAEKVGGVCFEGEEGDRDGTEALALWCREAEALDLATPESFRHHLALIGEIAEAEHEVRVDRRGD